MAALDKASLAAITLIAVEMPKLVMRSFESLAFDYKVNFCKSIPDPA